MYKYLDKLIDSVANRVATPAEARNLATTVWMAAGDAGLTVCDLKPMAELLGCEPEMGAITEEARSLLGSLVSANRQLDNPQAPRIYAAIAQALNWERTEFDTLDELLAELQATARVKYDELADALRERERIIRTTRERIRQVNEMLGAHKATFILDEIEAMLSAGQSGFTDGGYVADASEQSVRSILHGTEYYPGSTILLQTAQLVAWRDADGQEHCERAHRVTLNPDRDGLAAAILSGISSAQIAPEHIAELRAQMGGVL